MIYGLGQNGNIRLSSECLRYYAARIITFELGWGAYTIIGLGAYFGARTGLFRVIHGLNHASSTSRFGRRVITTF